MKKTYQKPQAAVTGFDMEDLLTASAFTSNDAFYSSDPENGVYTATATFGEWD